MLSDFLPLLATLLTAVLLLWLANWFLLKRTELGSEARLPRQLVMLGLTLLAVLAMVLVLPVSDATRGQVLSLLGLLLTGVIALSSTTFVANAMAGLMLRIVKSFRPGDFIHVGDQFGRVTERGLLHTEIQTEDRDLSTLPNLHLITHPVTVVHGSGTIISATLSLGYDVPHQRAETLLKQAAEQAGLGDAFVLVTELNDFSVSYRVAGFLPEVTQLLTAKSNLRRAVLDSLHGAGIEIMSPNYMNQRQLAPETQVIPPAQPVAPAAAAAPSPEAIIFDKAEEAAVVQQLEEERLALLQELKELEQQQAAAGEATTPDTGARIEALRQRLQQIEAQQAPESGD